MSRKAMIFSVSLLALSLALTPQPALSAAADCVVRVTEPRSGQEVGQGISVEGTATLSAGDHLWVFARRVNFEPLWWSQGEGTPDPATGKWKVFTVFGGPQDVSWDFDVAVAVFSREQHLQLKDQFQKAMETGMFRPIKMPAAACPPLLLKVKKTGND